MSFWRAFYESLGGHTSLMLIAIPGLIALVGWAVRETRREHGTDGLPDDDLPNVEFVDAAFMNPHI